MYNEETDLLLLGAGGHSKVIIDIIQNYYYNLKIIGVTDRDQLKIGQNILNVPIIGTDEIVRRLFKKGLRKALISLGMIYDSAPRIRLFNLIKDIGFECINIIHPASILSKHVTLGQGNAILAGTIINANVKIGDNCIINSGSIIEHDCYIGNHIHIAPGVKISGGVSIEDGCMIGIGATIIQGISIGANSVVAAGSVVIKDIPGNSVVAGVPAKNIKR